MVSSPIDVPKASSSILLVEKPCSHVTMIILLLLTETTRDTLDYHFHLIFFLPCSNTYQSSKTFEVFFVLVSSHITLMHMTNMKVANVCFVMAQFQVYCKNAPTFLPVDKNSTINESCHIYLHQIHAV